MNLNEIQRNDILMEVITGELVVVQDLHDDGWVTRHYIELKDGTELYFDSDLQGDAYLFVMRPTKII